MMLGKAWPVGLRFGLGDTTTPVVTTAVASPIDLYMAGLKYWASPSQAFSALGSTMSSAAFSGTALPATLGLWTPPILLAVVAVGAMSGKRGRR